jgi:hypothetical protein
MACQSFGSWKNALKACNIAPGGGLYNRFWNQALIVECIQLLHKNGHPLTVKTIWRDYSKSTTQLLMKSTGRWTTGAGLHDAARRFLGSWDEALIRAGIEVDDVKEKPFWTKRKMIAAIQALNQAHIPLNVMSMERDKSPQTTQLIKSRIGKGRTGRSLIGAAYRTFGSWDCALRESGLNPKDFRIRRFSWDRPSIARVIKALHRSEVPLNVGCLSKNSEERTRAIIQQTVGRKVQGRRIYAVGRQQHESWDELLRYSGFTPGLIRKRSAHCTRDKEQIIEFLQILYFNNHALNSTAVRKNSKQIQRFIEERFGQPVGGTSIFNTSQKLFGSWSEALWEAGLNPNEIRRRSPASTTHLPTVLSQIEDVKLNGERRRERFLGAPPKSPVEILEERNAATILKLAVDEMSEEEQELIEQIFDAILKIHHYRDRKQLIQYVSRYLGSRVSENQIELILSEIAAKIGRETDESHLA